MLAMNEHDMWRSKDRENSADIESWDNIVPSAPRTFSVNRAKVLWIRRDGI
jgi:hypothetical protein